MTASRQQQAVSSKKSGAKQIIKQTLTCLLLTVLLPTLSSAEPQQPMKAPRVGLLLQGTSTSLMTRLEGFQQRLRERGHVEGNTSLLSSGLTLIGRSAYRR